MRCGIFLCVCVLMIVALSEARSFSSGKQSLKSRFLSNLEARKESNEDDGNGKGDKDGEGKGEKRGDIPTASVNALMHGLYCLLTEETWTSVPEEALKTENWCDFTEESWFGCVASAFTTMDYVEEPEKRKELDQLYLTYSEAERCKLMHDIDERLKELYGEGPEKTLQGEYKFIELANGIMGEHCALRLEEQAKLEVKIGEEMGCTAPEESQQTAAVTKKSLKMKLRNLLTSALELRSKQQRGEEGERVISTAGFEAIATAGECLEYFKTATEKIDPEIKKICSDTIEGVKPYVTAIDAKEEETVDYYEHIFENYNHLYKCFGLEMMRDWMNMAVQEQGTVVREVLIDDIKVVTDFQGLICKHCAVRNAKFATMWDRENFEARRKLEQLLQDMRRKK